MANSDVNFLVFTGAGMRHGVVRELAYVADPVMKRKAVDCVVFDQIVNGGSSVPDLSMCDLRNAQIHRYEFSNELELRDGFLTNVQYYIVNKQDDLAGRMST